MNTRRIALVGIVLGLAGGFAAASETSTEVTVGIQNVDGRNESAKFQEYEEIPQGLFLEKVDFSLDRDDWFLELELIDLGQDDQSGYLRTGKWGTYRFTASYTQVPKWLSNTTRAFHVYEGDGLLTLPDPIQQDLEETKTNQADPATANLLRDYLGGSSIEDARYRRDTTAFAFRYTPGDNARLDVDYSTEKRSGRRPFWAGSYFSNGPDVIEFLTPIDYETTFGTVAFEWATSNWHIGGDLTASTFDNNVELRLGGNMFEGALLVDNPLRINDACNVFNFGPGPFPACDDNANGANAQWLVSQPPSNAAVFATVTGGYKVSDWGKLTATYTTGRHEQDENFLPFAVSDVPDYAGYEIRQGVDANGDVVTQFDGEIDITRWDARFVGRPVDLIKFKVYANSYDYDNQTPRYFLNGYVIGDTEPGGEVTTRPYGWKRDRFGGDVTFKLPVDLDVTVGYESQDWEREFRQVESSTEDILRASASYKLSDWGRISASWEDRDREADAYEIELGGEIWEETRYFDQVNREQTRHEARLDITPVEIFTFGVAYRGVDSEYDDEGLEEDFLEANPGVLNDKYYGRTEDELMGWVADFAVAIGARVTLYGEYGVDEWSFEQNSRYRTFVDNVLIDRPINDWSSASEDTYTTYGLGIRANLTDSLELKIDGLIVESENEIESRNDDFVPGGGEEEVPGSTEPGAIVEPYPLVTDERTRYSTELKWAVRENMDLRFGYLHEEWDREDWARDMVDQWVGDIDAGAGEWALLGFRIPNYDVDVVKASLSYRF